MYKPATANVIPKVLYGHHCYLMSISGNEYDICDKASSEFWSESKTGTYGEGLINTDDDPHKATRVGLLGEVAFAKIYGLQVDMDYHEGGNKTDFLLYGSHVDLKTAHRCPAYRAGLVYCTNQRGAPILLKSNYYVFAILREENRELRKAEIAFLGFAPSYIVERSPRRRGRTRHSQHQNYEVSYDSLLDLRHLSFYVQDNPFALELEKV